MVSLLRKKEDIMATKTFEELKQLAVQIRDEKTNKQNTATRIGTQMLEHLNKLEQDYYDKTATDEELKQRDEKLTELSSKKIGNILPFGGEFYDEGEVTIIRNEENGYDINISNLQVFRADTLQYENYSSFSANINSERFAIVVDYSFNTKTFGNIYIASLSWLDNIQNKGITEKDGVRTCVLFIVYKGNITFSLPEYFSITKNYYVKSLISVVDIDTSKKSIKRYGINNELLFNSYNSPDDENYSNLLLYLPNRKFANIRANNLILGNASILVLSKKESELERFGSWEEIPTGTSDSNVYLYPVKNAGFTDYDWDVICYNYNQNLTNLCFSNLAVTECRKINEYKNDGYINLTGGITPTENYFTVTDFIPIVAGTYVEGHGSITKNNYGIAFYDKNEKLISGITTSSETTVTEFNAVAPSNSAYFRACKSQGNDGAVYVYDEVGTLIKGVYEINSENTGMKYHNALKKPYNFYGKKSIWFGDSVTYGVSTNPWNDQLENCYRKLFCDYAGLECTNAAVSSSYIYNYDYDGITPLSTSILSKIVTTLNSESNYDFIFIAGGINDFSWHNADNTLGKLGDTGNISFYGALHDICEHIKNNAPNSNVIFLTPINDSKIREYIGSDTLDKYRNAIFEVAVMYGYSVVDMSVIGFPIDSDNTLLKDALIQDGIHPTELGHKMMAENLYSILI